MYWSAQAVLAVGLQRARGWTRRLAAAGIATSYFAVPIGLVGTHWPGIGQDTGEVAQRLAVILASEAAEVARDLELHVMLWQRHHGRAIVLHVVEEIAHLDVQGTGKLIEPPGGNAVDARLVFVRLLIGNLQALGQLLLRQTELQPRSRSFAATWRSRSSCLL